MMKANIGTQTPIIMSAVSRTTQRENINYFSVKWSEPFNGTFNSTTKTDISSNLNYLVGKVHCKNHRAVDQKAALFRQSEFQYPKNSKTVYTKLRSRNNNMIFTNLLFIAKYRA